MQKKMPVALLFMTALLVAGGCASFESAYYVDREFGQASQASWDRQILFPDYRYAGTIPAGGPGIIAEKIMAVHFGSYQKVPTERNVFSLGLVK